MDVNKARSQRAFVGVTLTTVLGIAIVLIVYAATLGTLYGGEVTVGGVSGNVYYSLTNSTAPETWTSLLEVGGTGTAWYAKLNTTGNEYVGPVTITWQLQQKQGGGSWTPLGTATVTSIDLTVASQDIYVSTSGAITTNRNWSITATTTASYRVVATIESTG